MACVRTLLTASLFGGVLLGSSAVALAQGAAPKTYACQGFDEPLKNGMNIPKGRVLPLRAKLVLPDGSFGNQKTIQTSPTVSFKFLPESGPEVDKTAGMEVRDYGKGNHFVWDDEAHWKFDLGTRNLTDNGKYRVTLLSGDEKEYRVDPTCTLEFNLRGGGD
jgi:hypothetical protein